MIRGADCLANASDAQHHAHMVCLTDDELALVMAACRPLPVEERDSFLRLLAVELGKHRVLFHAIHETQQKHFRKLVVRTG
jgi:hypothetical protein